MLTGEQIEKAVAGGLDPEAVVRLVERAQVDIDSGLLPSCQLAIARGDEVLLDVTLGGAEPGERYIMFSCTKAITAGAVWLLLADRRLGRHRPVAEYLPEFGSNGKDQVTIEQLLTHTSGFPAAPMGSADWADRSSRLKKYASWRLNWEPGTRFEYHPTSAHWVLADCIQAVTGIDYRTYIRRQLLDPLGLTGLQLGQIPDADSGGSAPTARPICHVGALPTPDALEAATGMRIDLSELLGEVTEEALSQFNRPENLAVGVPAGGAVSTAADLARYYQALLHNPGEIWDPEILNLGTGVALVDLPDPLRGTPSGRTLGLILAGDDGQAAMRGFGHLTSPRAFGHDGAGGQIAFADPDTDLSFCYFTDGHDRDLIRQWKRTSGLASRASACCQP